MAVLPVFDGLSNVKHNTICPDLITALASAKKGVSSGQDPGREVLRSADLASKNAAPSKLHTVFPAFFPAFFPASHS